MALNSDIAYKFGCGRYIQESQAIEKYLATELCRFGTKALFICGENGIRVAGDKIRGALKSSKTEYEMTVFHSTPCPENAEKYAGYALENGFDIICGVGGGVVGDTVKLVASKAGLPLVQIPTSSATCVSATPLSVMYDMNTHAHLGSLKLMKEADAVIVDLDIMIEQPKRLFWAGVMDSKAKMIELTHRLQDKNEDEIPLGLDTAYDLSKTVYNFYTDKYNEISAALADREITKVFEKAIFYAIAITGIISGISKGSNQCALAHKFYEETRTYFYEEAKDFVHGELVAMGLIIQLAYNGLDYESMISDLEKMNLKTKLSQINIPVCEDTLNIYTDCMCASSAIEDSSDEAKKKVRNAIMTIYK